MPGDDVDAEIAKQQQSRGVGLGDLQDEDGVYTKDRFAGFEGSIAPGEAEEDDGEEDVARNATKRSTFTAPKHLLEIEWQTPDASIAPIFITCKRQCHH